MKIIARSILFLIIIISNAYGQTLGVVGDSYKGKYKSVKVGLECERNFGGENLFTGDVGFSLPIAQIGGLDVELAYSSNVHHLISAPNWKQQSGWVGIGWELKVGSIVGEINETVDPTDDRYFYQGPEASTELIYLRDNEFILKDYKFWKIKRIVDESHIPARVLGWEIIREDGTKYRYGNYNYIAEREDPKFVLDYEPTNATQFKLAWGNLVSNPPSTCYESASYAPHRWDLSDIEDIFGNHTTILYQQVKDSLRANYTDPNTGKLRSTKPYTRESYMYKIIDRVGNSVKFIIGPTASEEYTYFYGINIQQQYQTQQLNRVERFNQKGELINRIEFGYTDAGVYDAATVKRFLTSLTTKNALGEALPGDVFEYYKVGGVEDGPNHGALKKQIISTGGEVEYQYTTQQLTNVKLDTTFLCQNLNNSSLQQQFASYAYSINVLGMSGKDFFLLQNRNITGTQLNCYRFGPNGWKTDPEFPMINTYSKVWVRGDYVLARSIEGNNLSILKRVGDSWHCRHGFRLSKITIQYDIGGTVTKYPDDIILLGMGNDFFVVEAHYNNGSKSCFEVRQYVIWWDNEIGDWNFQELGDYGMRNSYPDDDLSPWREKDDPRFAACGNRFFVINSLHKVWCWNGINWQSYEIQNEDINGNIYSDNCFKPFVGEDYIVLLYYGVKEQDYIRRLQLGQKTYPCRGSSVYSWNGQNWSRSSEHYMAVHPMTTFGNYFCVKRQYDENIPPDLAIFYKKVPDFPLDNTWIQYNLTDTHVGNLPVTQCAFRGDLIAFNFDQQLYISRFQEKPVQIKLNGFPEYIDGDWSQYELAQPLVNNNSIFASFVRGNSTPPSMFGYGLFKFQFKDQQWTKEELLTYSIGNGYGKGACIQPGSNFLAAVYSVNSNHVDGLCSAFKQGFDQNFSDIFKNYPYDFPVIKKILRDQNGHEYITTMQYENGTFDEDMISAKYNKVIVSLPESNGKIVTYYYNKLSRAQLLDYNDCLNPSGVEQNLSGLSYQIRYLDDANNEIMSSKIYNESLFERWGTPTNKMYMYYCKPIMIDTIKYGVVSRTAIDYSESNGELCRLIRKTDVDNGEENKRGSVREVIYAYQEYASMGAEQKHMLNQIYEDKINSAYIENLSTEEVSLSSEKMEAGWRTIYENDLPKQQQVWIGPGIKDWQIVQSIINRDAVGNIIETEDANGIRSQYYYGHNKSLKIAEFFNTSNEKVWADNFDDGSIDDSDPMIWSKSGMWTINHGILKSTNTAYLGNHNAEVQNFKFDIALRIVNDYSNIANWAGVHFGSTSNNIFNSGYLIYYRENGEINLYHEGSNLFSVFTGLVPNVWRHLSISVDGTKIEVFIDGQRFIDYSLSEPVPSGFVSLNSYQADTEYDDFRCYPVRAIAQSHAYDSLWSKENIFSDPNGRALSIKYDSFGRIQSIQDLYSENMFSNYLYYYSRSGNLSYNQLDPNYVLTQTWLKPGVYINSKNFYDGLNRMLQSQILVSEGKIITPKEYEALGRIVRVYKPYFMANTTLGFDPNYLNNDIGYYLNIGLFNVSNYPYAENEFYRDPLNRLKLAAFPGLTFKKGGKNILYTYGSDRINELFYVTKTDENGIKETIFTDKSGNHIKTIADSTALRLTTAFKYDILGRIVKSIPPRGDLLASAYVYNPKSQLVQKTTPDAGTVQYLYDKVGNLRLIKDAGHTGTVNNISISGVKEPTNSPEGSFILTLPGKVNLSLLRAYLISGSPVGNLIILSNGVEVCRVTVNSSTAASLSIVLPKGSYTYTSTVSGGSGVYPYTITCNTGCEFIYNKYDSFNRITENGEYESNSTGNFTQANANNPSFPTSGTIVTKKFFYDTPSTNSIASGQRNLRGQLSYSYTYQLGSICEEMYYSYDNFGNVEWIIQKTAGTPIGKKIQYKYDLQGNITQKNYYDLDNSSNNISFFYEYDLAGRLSKVYSDQNANGTSRVLEAIYTYNADGSVKRLQLGNAQGVDYTYNERGWLTMINHQNLGGVDNNGQPQDPGRDGFDSGLPADKFGEVIGYNNIDYHIGAPQYQNTTPQFNGNISWLMYAIQNVKFNGTQLCGWTYSYDGANRLTKADFGYYTNAWLQSNAYDLPAISYDPNGNILSLNRLSYSGIRLDNLSYTYQVNTNRLTSVFNQVNNRKQTYTYTYDSNGNMTSDSYRGLSIILYNTQNLPEQITKSNGNIVRYWYDANGNRLRKQEQASNGSILMDETYVLGIDGQTEAVYNTTTGALKFWNINAGGQMIGRIEP